MNAPAFRMGGDVCAENLVHDSSSGAVKIWLTQGKRRGPAIFKEPASRGGRSYKVDQRSFIMRKSILAVAAVAGLLGLPTLASAQEGVAAGAATGAAAGAIVGGPVGAAVGGVAGAATGAAAESAARPPEAVIVTQPPSTGTVTSERTCTTDGAGNRTCTEIRR
jgi:hypothetical protein